MAEPRRPMVQRIESTQRGKRAKARPPKQPKTVIDRDALALVKAGFEAERVAAEVERRRKVSDGRTLPVTGRCHDCDRPVSGERRFCGRCLASH